MLYLRKLRLGSEEAVFRSSEVVADAGSAARTLPALSRELRVESVKIPGA